MPPDATSTDGEAATPVDAAVGPSGRWPGTSVLVWGFASTVATLGAIRWLQGRFEGFEPMGFYVNLVIPAGAIAVGLLAGSGYGIGSWRSGAKAGIALIAIILVMQTMAYWAAQRQEYRAAIRLVEQLPAGFIQPPTFFEYYDQATRSMAWQDGKGGFGKPFGAWGYGIRALEILGFVGGAILIPLILRTLHYCENCAVYTRRKSLGVLPAGVPVQKTKRMAPLERMEYEKSIETEFTNAQKLVEELRTASEAGDGTRAAELLKTHGTTEKLGYKLTARCAVTLHRCPRCRAGEVEVILSSGQADQMHTLGKEAWAITAETAAAMTGEG